jgi:hypothetical protein
MSAIGTVAERLWQTVAVGTKPTCHDVRDLVANGCKADMTRTSRIRRFSVTEAPL